MPNLQAVEKIRLRLDSIGVDDLEYERFIDYLYYVANNLYNGELKGRQYMVDNLKSNRSYQFLSEKEVAILIDNMELISIMAFGILEDRFPHKLDRKSLRLKEISQYGIKSGDRILHFSALNNRLGELLYLSYDSIQITFNPFRFRMESSKVFDVIASSGYKPSNSLGYIFEKFPKPVDNMFYDKVIFDCVGILFFTIYPDFKKKIKTIHNLLSTDGELIVGANYQTPPFEGPFHEISAIDKKMKRILDCGFELKEKVYSENEYIIYKFRKVVK